MSTSKFINFADHVYAVLISCANHQSKCGAVQSAGGHHKQSPLSNGAQSIVNLATAAEDFNGIFAGVLDIPGLSASSTSTLTSALDPAPAPALTPATSSTKAFQTSPQRHISVFKLAQQEDWMTLNERLLCVTPKNKGATKVMDTFVL
jgi:hypothetical protein